MRMPFGAGIQTILKNRKRLKAGQLLQRLAANHDFVMFVEIGLRCAVSRQLDAVFSQDIAYTGKF